MVDDTVQGAGLEIPGDSPEAIEAAEDQAAQSFLDQRRGGQQAQEAAIEGAEAQQEPSAPRAGVEEAHQHWRERETRRQREQRLVEEGNAIREENNRLRRAIEEALKEEPAPAPKIPDLEADPAGWYRAQMRAELEEKLGPIEAFVEQQRQRDAWIAQETARRQEFESAVGDLRQTINEAEQDYEATESGEGYRDRLKQFAELDQRVLMRSGHTKEQAATIVARAFDGMVGMAMQAGMNPAAYVDRFISSWIEEVGARPASGGGNGVTKRQPDQKVAALNRAANSSMAGSLSQRSVASKGAAGDPIKRAINTGNVEVDHVKAMMKDRKGSSRQKLRDILRDLEAATERE